MANLIRSGDVTFRGEYTTVDAYPLVCGPYGIPYLINLPGSGVRIKGELYAVTDSGIVPMDDLEGVEAGHYERLPLKVAASDGDGPESTVAAEAYFAHRSFGEGAVEEVRRSRDRRFHDGNGEQVPNKGRETSGFQFSERSRAFHFWNVKWNEAAQLTAQD
nr:putative gamma-glutamylcyclotransferase At3g02910 [Ipomoea batatas]